MASSADTTLRGAPKPTESSRTISKREIEVRMRDTKGRLEMWNQG